MKKVMVSEYRQHNDRTWKLEEKGEALFHAFGVNCEQFGEGAGNFSTAIIEWPNGKLENVAVEVVRFLVPSVASEPKDIEQ